MTKKVQKKFCLLCIQELKEFRSASTDDRYFIHYLKYSLMSFELIWYIEDKFGIDYEYESNPCPLFDEHLVPFLQGSDFCTSAPLDKPNTAYYDIKFSYPVSLVKQLRKISNKAVKIINKLTHIKDARKIDKLKVLILS